MATFKFSGDFDKVSAELKKTLEAQEAKFNSTLQTLFKSESASMVPRVRATAPQTSPGQSSNSMGTRSSKSEDSGTARSRLRSSIRPR